VAKNFLALVNDTLKEASIIQGDAGEFTSFTDSARQIDIDMAKSSINDVIQEIYSIPNSLPRSQLEGRFTLATGKREYSTETDFEMMAFNVIRNQDDGRFIVPYPGGWQQMWNDQIIPADFTGQPIFWVINPENGKFRLERSPTSTEAGQIFRYIYVKTLSLSDTTDLLPFSDQAAQSLTPAFAQVFKRKRDPQNFDPGLFQTSLARGIRYITQRPQSESYGVAGAFGGHHHEFLHGHFHNGRF